MIHIRQPFFALQILLIALLSAMALGLIKINMTNIKVYERKLTEQTYHYYGGTYEWDNVKRNLHWEDGAFILNHDYEKQLRIDLTLLSKEYEHISTIDPNENILSTGDYKVKVCVEEFDYSVNDTTMTKSLGQSYFSGYLELYNKSMSTLLFKHRDRRFIVSNKLTITGLAQEEFIRNKIVELLYTEIIDLIPELVNTYDWPQQYRKAKFMTKVIIETYWGISLEQPQNRDSEHIRNASIKRESSDDSTDASK